MPKTEQLMVVEPFGDHGFGDLITEPSEMKRALSHHPHHVLRQMVDAEEPAEGAAEEADTLTPTPEDQPPAGGRKPRKTAE